MPNVDVIDLNNQKVGELELADGFVQQRFVDFGAEDFIGEFEFADLLVI